MENCKIKRRRYTAHKRWSEEEVRKILEYLLKHLDIEKPTARVYYKKLLEATHINASWDLIRWKVRNLKVSYLKTETWKKTIAAELHDYEEQLNKNKCRFYDELDNIFGRKSSNIPFEVLENTVSTNISNIYASHVETSSNEEANFSGFDDCSVFDISETEMPTSSANPIATLPPSPPPDIKEINCVEEFAAELKGGGPNSSLEQLSAVQRERNDVLKAKLEFEKEKFKQEQELKLRQFEESVKEREEKFQLKKLEMEKEERLRTLEIEMKYKYKYQYKYK